MVDVTDKNVTEREAIATGKIFVCDETYERIINGNMAKEMSLQLLEWLELWRLKNIRTNTNVSSINVNKGKSRL